MSVPTHDYEWEQGADLVIPLVYKTGSPGAETPTDLTAYSLRMDISSLGARIYTFNSADITDLDGTGPGTTGDTTKEAVLGADGTINIAVPRILTLPGPSGVIYTEMASNRNIFDYDIFLRDAADKQLKILSGKITVNKSVTLWA